MEWNHWRKTRCRKSRGGTYPLTRYYYFCFCLIAHKCLWSVAYVYVMQYKFFWQWTSKNFIIKNTFAVLRPHFVLKLKQIFSRKRGSNSIFKVTTFLWTHQKLWKFGKRGKEDNKTCHNQFSEQCMVVLTEFVNGWSGNFYFKNYECVVVIPWVQ